MEFHFQVSKFSKKKAPNRRSCVFFFGRKSISPKKERDSYCNRDLAILEDGRRCVESPVQASSPILLQSLLVYLGKTDG